MRPVVVAEKLALNQDDLVRQFQRSFSEIGMDVDFNKARAVFIKPNLTYPYYKEGVTTSFGFIRALIAALRRLNDETVIYIGEGEGGYNSFSMSEALVKMGFDRLETDFKMVKLVNLSHMPVSDFVFETSKGPYVMKLPEIFSKDIDFSISCPVPKVHCMTGVSLSYKNQWGCIPDNMRLRNHYMFDDIISKMTDGLKFRYAFLDGRYGLNNNGPIVGDPVELGWFVGSNSLGAFDMIVSGMMGLKWRNIRHLKLASDYGRIPERSQIRIAGDALSMKRRFVLRRNFWNFIALAAFRSRLLTHFFYLSKYADPLHDLMYRFRKRPIS